MLTSDTGWARTDRNIFFTSTAGEQWSDITPRLRPEEQIDALHFVGTTQAWAVIHSPDVGAGPTTISVANTTDGGKSWVKSPLKTTRFILDGYGARAQISFSDATHGWILLAQAGSSASSFAHLFATSDGGKSWSPLPDPPVNGEIQLVSESTGWLEGGVFNNFLYRTQDGGQSWLEIKIDLPDDITPYSIPELGETFVEKPALTCPHFETPETGVISVTIIVRFRNRRRFRNRPSIS